MVIIVKKVCKYALNTFLGLLMCVPVITVGASVTAMHFVNFKLADDVDTKICKEFFKSFKQNFKQSLILTVIILGLGALFTKLWLEIFKGEGETSVLLAAFMFILTMLYFNFECLSTYLLAKFDNTTKRLLILTGYCATQNTEKMMKVALMEAAVIALPVLIYAVNPSNVSLSVAIVLGLVLLVIYEILSVKLILPIYDTLIKAREENGKKNDSEDTEE